jgi:Signal transduction histidine kinase
MIIALTMWIATIILGIADYKTESTRWAMGLTFFAGLAGFSMFWAANSILMIHYFGLTAETHKIIEAVLSALSHYFIPYTALMFGVRYSKFFDPKYKKLATLFPLVPMVITFLCFPNHDYHITSTYQGVVYYRYFSIWAVPYLLASCVLQIYAYRKEDIPSLRRQRLIFCLIAVPGIVFTSITTYLLSGLPFGKPWKYWDLNVFIILYMFILFLYCIINYGVLGVKIRIEKQNLSNMMNAMDSGIKILSHSLKNELTNISICMTNMKLSLANPVQGDAGIDENFQMVSASLEHLSDMMKKLQKSSIDPGKFTLTQNNLAEIVDTGLNFVAVFLKSKNIRVLKSLDANVSILSDKVYLQEVFVNLFQNAVEAMNDNGELVLETVLTTRNLIIVIKDNGAGIAEQDLPHILEPFFTTKNKRENFGLGLSYCYNLLKKHGASLEIQSAKNMGTTVSLFFPRYKVILK